MKTVKKHTTFEDLKLSEKKTMDTKAIVEKHNEFEKVIKDIYAARVHKKANPISK